ncbi:MAG: nucleotide exchange factor GrpE [Gemmatimonadota bacterium]|nr:nucleotide exchange factor GrpE [Gemmatimonadota bacterium]
MKERSRKHDRPEDAVEASASDELPEGEVRSEREEGARVETETEGAEEEGDEDELTTLRAEFDELNDRHLRLAAEFNNFRRRSEQERQESWSRAQADLLAQLLDVLDDLQRVAGLDASSTTVESVVEGVDLVERKFGRVLEDAGVEIIDPQEELFDPERMEAIMRVPAESDEMDDHVAEVFQKGYALKGVLVRPARVSVYKHG